MGQGVIGRVRGAVRVRSRLAARHDAASYRRTFTLGLASDVARARHSDVGIVVHLYHVDVWPEIFERLRRLPPSKADLFITTPPGHLAAAAKVVRADVGAARLIPTPNRGRDVLPFIKTAALLQQAGYLSVLKVHSKKSVHHPEASGWLGWLLDELLPSDVSQMDAVLSTLSDPSTGIIGPQGSFHPSSHFLSDNCTLIRTVLRDLYGRRVAASIIEERLKDLGFFAGTMFWARLDAISPLFSVPPARFEAEGGQADATMAHALERLFTFVPQLDDRAVLAIGRRGGLEPLARADEPAR